MKLSYVRSLIILALVFGLIGYGVAGIPGIVLGASCGILLTTGIYAREEPPW